MPCVIALACRNLPRRERTWGILLGAGAAVVLRIIFTVIIQHLLGIPWLQLIGGLLLFWIAVKLLIADEPDDGSVASGSNLWEAVKIVAIADVVMSLDNVLAIAAAAMQTPAEQQIWLIVLGLLISIPLVIAGSTLIMSLLTRYPVLVWAGAALLGWIAGELLVTDVVSVTQVQAWNPALVVVDPEVGGGAAAGWPHPLFGGHNRRPDRAAGGLGAAQTAQPRRRRCTQTGRWPGRIGRRRLLARFTGAAPAGCR